MRSPKFRVSNLMRVFACCGRRVCTQAPGMLKLALHHQLVRWRFEAVSSSAAEWSAEGLVPQAPYARPGPALRLREGGSARPGLD